MGRKRPILVIQSDVESAAASDIYVSCYTEDKIYLTSMIYWFSLSIVTQAEALQVQKMYFLLREEGYISWDSDL